MLRVVFYGFAADSRSVGDGVSSRRRPGSSHRGRRPASGPYPLPAPPKPRASLDECRPGPRRERRCGGARGEAGANCGSEASRSECLATGFDSSSHPPQAGFGESLVDVVAVSRTSSLPVTTSAMRRVQVKLIKNGRPSGAALPSIDLSVVRGVGSSMVVPGSVGSYRPVIAGAKLREGATTILPRGRALQGVGLSSMRFHPTGGGPEEDKDGQEAWFTARIASLIG